MDFFMILLFVILLAIYDMVRRVNRNILEQTEEIKKLHDNMKE
jgi:hypothetical protein